MITILYSYNKRGYEAEYWAREIAAASNESVRFLPFNHDPFLDDGCYVRAQLLDNAYYARNAGLEKLYAHVSRVLVEEKVDVLLVDTCAPYHPEYLLRLEQHKVLRIADGPLAAYDRDFAYLHAYDQILYHSPAYSRDLGMKEKLEYCRAGRADLWPLGVFDAMRDSSATEDELMAKERDVEIVFVGAMHPNKMPLLARVKREFGSRCVLRGLTSLKKNVYFNVKYGFPGWVKPLDAREYVKLYQRARIGINLHNRGKYTVGSYRLFELPANGVMQISDGGAYLDAFFERGKEIESYETADELVELIRYYLDHDAEREAMARAGYRRAIRDHRMSHRLHEAVGLIRAATSAPA